MCARRKPGSPTRRPARLFPVGGFTGFRRFSLRAGNTRFSSKDARAGLLIFDLLSRNAIQAADGQVFPNDPVIQRITPEFGQFLREQPYTINLR